MNMFVRPRVAWGKLFLNTFVLICTVAVVSMSQPKLTIVGGTRFDFGDLVYGIAKKNLTIRNEGKDTLILSNVSASCGCTAALPGKERIAPHDSTSLAITFNTRNISGHAEKAVSLDTNDPTQNKVRIVFTANVTGVLDLQPDYVYFQAQLDSPSVKSVVLKNRGTSEINLSSITSSLENISLKLSQTQLKPAEQATLTAVLTPRAKGTFKGEIVIKTDNPKLPSVTVRVVGLVIQKNSPGNSSH